MKLILLLLKEKTPITLDLQHQMVDDKKDLNDTTAGRELQADIIRERKNAERAIAEMQEEHKEAIQARDMEAAQALAEVREDYTKRIAELDQSLERMKINTEKLIEEKWERLLKEQEVRRQQDVQRLEREIQRGEELRKALEETRKSEAKQEIRMDLAKDSNLSTEDVVENFRLSSIGEADVASHLLTSNFA